MIRVVMAGDYPLDPRRIRGGIEAVTYQLAKGLAQTGEVELHVVTRRKDVTRYRQETTGDGYTMHFLPSPRRLSNLLSGPTVDRLNLRRTFRSLAPDLIHAHGQEWYAYAALETGLPTVVTVHGILHRETELLGHSLAGRVRGLLYNYSEESVLRRARHVILISPYVAEMIRPWSHAQTYAIDNPVDERFFALDGTAEGNGNVLFVGNLSPRKGLPNLLAAFVAVTSARPDALLTIAGRARDGAFLAGLKAKAHALGLDRGVDFAGHVSEEHLLELYRTCTLLVLPSLEETSPVAVAQALAAGKPVVATRVGGVPYMLRDGKTGFLVAQGDTEALALSIVRLLKDDDLRRAMGQEAKLEARQRFSLANVAHKTLAAYRSMLAGRGE
ncbi:MAG: glycosyltransferase family 4 protein [Anaerolineae bacterium]|nr:glycosyltransferase family 4 protein [Anaerolineae bacterium]